MSISRKEMETLKFGYKQLETTERGEREKLDKRDYRGGGWERNEVRKRTTGQQ